MTYTYSDIAKTIDHSLLPPVLTAAELEAGCLLARRYQVASVCILPCSLSRCAELLHGSGVEPSTTIGFSHGGHTTGGVRTLDALPAMREAGASRVGSSATASILDECRTRLGLPAIVEA